MQKRSTLEAHKLDNAVTIRNARQVCATTSAAVVIPGLGLCVGGSPHEDGSIVEWEQQKIREFVAKE